MKLITAVTAGIAAGIAVTCTAAHFAPRVLWAMFSRGAGRDPSRVRVLRGGVAEPDQRVYVLRRPHQRPRHGLT